MDKMRGGGGQKMSVFVHAQGSQTVHAGGGGVKKWQNSVHVVVECPLISLALSYSVTTLVIHRISHDITRF